LSYPKSSKASAISANLASNILQRGSAGPVATAFGAALPVVESFGAAGDPLISIGTLTTGAVGALIRTIAQPWPLSTDILGNAANVFTPTVVQIALEAEPAGGFSVLATQIARFPVLLAILGEALSTGARVELWASASGSTITETTLNAAITTGAAALLGIYENFQNPLTGNV
jgi:hypothetical protein